MQEFKNDIDILKFAIDRETRANQFYLVWAQRMRDPTKKAIFEELAIEELSHKSKLELEVIKRGKVVDFDEVVEFKFDDSMSNIVFDVDMKYEDILFIGIEKEKAAFRVYTEMMSITKDEQLCEVIQSLAEEEVRHKIMLEAEYESLMEAGGTG